MRCNGSKGLRVARGRQIYLKGFLRDDPFTREVVGKPEVGSERVVGSRCDDAVFEDVARCEAEDADGFDSDVLVGGGVDNGRIRIVGDGAGENVSGAAAGMRDMDERDFDGLEGTVVVEIDAGELADAEFVVDMDASVDFFPAVAVGFEAVASFEKLDLIRIF